jgi:hypothetical protein
MVRRAIPASLKEQGHQGPGKDNVIQGIRKGRTFGKMCRAQFECNIGISNRDLKERLCLGSKGDVNKAFREILGLKIAKRIAGFSFRIRKINVRTFSKSQPLRRKEETTNNKLRDRDVGALAILGTFAFADR